MGRKCALRFQLTSKSADDPQGISCGHLQSSVEREVNGNHTCSGKRRKKVSVHNRLTFLLPRKLESGNCLGSMLPAGPILEQRFDAKESFPRKTQNCPALCALPFSSLHHLKLTHRKEVCHTILDGHFCQTPPPQVEPSWRHSPCPPSHQCVPRR